MGQRTISIELYEFMRDQLSLLIGAFYDDPTGWADSTDPAEVRSAYVELRKFSLELGIDFDTVAHGRSDFERDRVKELVFGD